MFMSHPNNETKSKLLDSTVKLIENLGIDRVTSTLVLTDSGVSKSSMYHFFNNFGDLVTEAQILQYRELDQERWKSLRRLVSDSSTTDEFYSGFVRLIQSLEKQEDKSSRLRRINAIGKSMNSTSLKLALAEMEEIRLDEMTQALELAQAKGFVVSVYDPRSIALTIQSLAFGKILDDTLHNPMDDQQWTSITLQVFKSAFMSKD
jgi:AcrR family transcriptional regulator